MRRLRPFVLPMWLIALAAPLITPGPAVAQPPADALVVEAETVVFDEAGRYVEAAGNVRLRYRGVRLRAEHARFDLAREVLTARGAVSLIDPAGRELVGDSITYDVRLGLAEVQRAQTVLDGVYLRSERIVATEQRVVATEAMATTCDPARPAYRITAAEIEVIPGDRLVARRAAVWVGGIRLFTLPTVTVSLRPGAEGLPRSVPRLGYNTVDGVWVDYLYGYRLGDADGGLYLKYGGLTGLIVRNTLRYDRSGYAVELALGRNQDAEMRIVDEAALTAHTPWLPVGAPARLRLGAGTGWFEEMTTGLKASRTFGEVSLEVPAVTVGGGSLAAAFTYRHAWYGTGAVQGVIQGGASLSRPLTPVTSLTLAYRILEVGNGTPFLFDQVLPEDRVHEASVVLNRSGVALGARRIQLYGGAGYDIRGASPVLLAGVVAPDPSGLSLSLGLRYGLNLQELVTSLDVGASIGPSVRLAIFAEYNARTAAFTEFDYTLTARFCDCVEASLKYRQVRREVWFQIGLIPQSRGPSIPR